MGKQARIARQQREAFQRQHPVEMRLVEQTHAAMQHAWDGVVEACRAWTQQQRFRSGVMRQVHALKLEPSEVTRWRANARTSGVTWPDWCYYPATLQVVALADGCGWGRSEEAVLPMGSVAAATAGIGAWHAAPLIARFDPDLAAAVLDTPLTGDLPFDGLRRLPSWGVVIPLPWLHDDALALVWADTGQVHVPDSSVPHGDETLDEMFVMLLGDNDEPLTLRLRFSEPTIVASLAAQQADVDERGVTNFLQTDDVDALVAERFDTTPADVLEKVLALALYLTSEQSDAVDALTVDATGQQRRRSGSDVGTDIVDVGFRIGSALRAHRSASSEASDSLPTGDKQAPHIRSAHWHTYWFGPRSQPELRYRATRWLPPIGVNIDLDSPPPTTVRPVAAPAP